MTTTKSEQQKLRQWNILTTQYNKTLELISAKLKAVAITNFQRQTLSYAAILSQIFELFVKKGLDYGTQDDHYSNLRESARMWLPDKPAWVAPLIRQGDKLIRIQNFLKNGKLQNESVEDSLRDNAVYALNALAMYLEEQEKK